MNSIRSSPLLLTRVTASFLLLGAFFSMVNAQADTPVSGKYLVNGKSVELKYAKAVKGEPFDNKATTLVVLSEKDASKSKKPDNDAMFGKLGGALVLTITAEGELVGTQVVKDKVQFGASGNVKLSDYKAEGGNVSGKVTTDGEQQFFKDTWQIDVSFSVAGP